MAYTEKQKTKIINTVCEKIEDGESLREAAKGLIPIKTFYTWIEADEKKSERYARATEERANLLFEEILEIVDDDTKDKKTHGISVSRDRLRIDARKWYLSKVNPKKYGDKVDITSKGKKVKTVISFGGKEVEI